MRVEAWEVPTGPLGEGRGDQDSPKTPHGPPRTPLGLPKTPPGHLLDTHRCPVGPSLTTRKTFPKHLAQSPFSERSKKSKSLKSSRKNNNNVHPRWSLDTIAHKNRKYFHNGRTPMAAVVARSALQYDSSHILELFRLTPNCTAT